MAIAFNSLWLLMTLVPFALVIRYALEMPTVKRALTGVDFVIQSLGVWAGPEIVLKPTRL